MLYAALFIVLIVAAVFIFIQSPKFGRQPTGDRRVLTLKSPHYHDGSFKNLEHTPDLTEGATLPGALMEFIFSKNPRRKPVGQLPTGKINLHGLDRSQNVLVWMGHSSYFIQLDGKRMLVDPVFSGAASPIAFTTRAFARADRYTPDDIPPLDFLMITHDHWDHLDYKTVLALRPKVNLVLTGLGTGEHLERWGYDPTRIVEKDWNEKVILAQGFVAHVLPARHFSGRTFRRNQALWISIALETPSRRIFLGGDSGYGSHFAEIGKKFDGFDLVILENGQYDKNWKYIHMMPEEVVKAAGELGAKELLAVHNSKFALANHAWDDPLLRVYAAAEKSPVKLLTPVIGELLNLDDKSKEFSPWWVGVE